MIQVDENFAYKRLVNEELLTHDALNVVTEITRAHTYLSFGPILNRELMRPLFPRFHVHRRRVINLQHFEYLTPTHVQSPKMQQGSNRGELGSFPLLFLLMDYFPH